MLLPEPNASLNDKHMKVQGYILVFSLAMLSLSLKAEYFDAQNLLTRANNYYSEAIYDSALITYHQITDAGIESAALYYNMANTYFKLRDFPSSILYYEKARKLAPADPDILFNLEIANSMIVDKVEPLPQMFYRIWWNRFYSMYDSDTWAWISVVVFVLTLAMLLIYLLANSIAMRKFGFFAGLLFLLLTITTLGLASQKYYYTQQISEAIIFTPTITVKSSPAANSVDLFVLHEGTKVLLLDEATGWHKIKIANGSIGWLPAESLKGI
jgi:tetratricopeptide (TPR) repeat protein